MSIIKIKPIGRKHAANVIRYAMEKNGAKNPADRPVFLAASQVTINELTGRPTSPLEVWQDFEMKLATCGHDIKDPVWRAEFCPPPEECQDWNMDEWLKYLNVCIDALDSTNYREVPQFKDGMPIIDTKTGKQKVKVIGQHTMLKDAPYIATIHFDTQKPHVHVAALRVTADNQVMSTHKYKERAKMAANKVAAKYGWTKAEDRPCKRMERIHAIALKVLKSMDNWNLETYFERLRQEGLKIDPTYDKQGICRGYAIGEKVYAKDGTHSSTVMYKASSKGFGNGRDLTVSKLYNTWRRQHPEKIPRSGRWASAKQQLTENLKSVNSHEKEVVSKTREAAAIVSAPKPTAAQQERESAIRDGLSSISELIRHKFGKRSFNLLDTEDILPAAIAAKAINMSSTADGWREPDALENAARQLVSVFEIDTQQAAEITDGLLAVIVDMAYPPVMPSVGGGGGPTGGWEKKKDDDWEWWKKHGFTNKQRRGLRR